MPSVLVVEDDATIRETLAETLGDEGWNVLTAANGLEAWHLLTQGPSPTVIVLDLMMPLMDGHEFMELLQKDTARQRIPVIQISASMHRPIAGVAAKLDKPFLFDALLRTMLRVSDPPAQEPRLMAAARS